MGKAAIKNSAGLKRPRSKILEHKPRCLELFEHCTAAIHGEDGSILAIRPHLTTKRLFNENIDEILGMPLTGMPSGIADPILEGLELAKKDHDGFAVVRYDYNWDGFDWVFHVKFQHDKETGETIRLTYDDLENPQQRQRQIDYWLWKIAGDPAIAYVD